MECLLQNTTVRGKSLDAGGSLRPQKRPPITNSLEDFGSTFAPQYHSTRRDERATKDAHKELKHAKVVKNLPSYESEDELLLSSQTSQTADDEDHLPPKAKNPKKQQKDIAVGGSRYLQQKQSQVEKPNPSQLAGLRFKKIKSNCGAGEPRTQPGPASLSPKSSSLEKLPNRPNSSYGSYPELCSTPRTKDPHDDSMSSDYSQSGAHPGRTLPRPKPRPLTRATNRRELALEEIPINSQAKAPLRCPWKVKAAEVSETTAPSLKKPVLDTNNSRRSTLTQVHPIKNLNCPTPTIKKPQHYGMASRTSKTASPPEAPAKMKDFPVLSPLSLEKRDLVSKKPPVLITLPQRVNKRGPEKPGPQPFPMPFPVEGTGKSPDDEVSDSGKSNQAKPKPQPKWRKSDKEVQKVDRLCNAGNRKATNKDGRNSSRPVPQPFPMSTQILKSFTSDGSPSRTLQEGASNGTTPKFRKKKRKSDLVVEPSSDEEAHNSSGLDRDEDFSLLSVVDPKLLCPFCDVLLPQPATPLLQKLISNALRKSRHDPRPGNHLGRTAPSAVFVNVCQRHRFESEELPKAESHGWPKSIDWENLGHRVRNMQHCLEELLGDIRAGMDVSPLWEDLKQELQSKGSRAFASVREQFANFEKAQAGYYGELGYAIIHQTLLDLFPPTSCDLDFADPLTPEQFVQRVLVPDVAMRLIKEDMDIEGPSAHDRALQVLRDSSKYGVAMFPDDSAENTKDFSDSDQLGVADQIVLERARKRRKELEEEYHREQEQELRRTERKKERQRTKRKEREKGPKSSRGENCFEKTQRPRPRPIQRNRSASLLHQALTPRSGSREGSMEHSPSPPKTSQDSTIPTESLEARSDHCLFTDTEDEILVPDSDERERRDTPLLTMGASSRSPSLTTPERASDDAATELTSSEEEVEIGTPFSRRRKKKLKRRESEEEESTPKPAKLRRTGTSGLAQCNSQPLLLAQRRKQQTGTDDSLSRSAPSMPQTAAAGNGDLDSGLWLKSMIVDSNSGDSDFRWLLSDSSQEWL